MNGNDFMPLFVDFTTIGLVFTAIVNLTLGILVYRRAPKALLNRIFLGFAISASAWVVAVFMIVISDDYHSLLFWGRGAHAAASLVPCFILALAYALSTPKKYPYKKVYFVFILGIVLAIISGTPAIIADVATPLEEKELVYGQYFLLYPAFYGGVILFALYKLWSDLKKTRGIIRYQIRYFLGGILVSFIIASFANLFLPLTGWSSVAIRNLGPMSVLVGLASITYAIVRYRLMDINFAIRKSISYALSIILVSLVYMFPIFGLEVLASVALPGSFIYFYVAFIAVTLPVVFPSLNKELQTFVDRYFYGGAYDYFDTLLATSRAMTPILQRDELLRFVLDQVVESMRISGATFYLQEVDGSFQPFAQQTAQNSVVSPPLTQALLQSELVDYLQGHGEPLLQSDLDGSRGETEQNLLYALDSLEVGAAVPILMDHGLTGVLVLGAKISGEPYSREDARLLSFLSSQIAVSLRKAQLHQEVLTYKRYLENILDNMGNGLIAVDAAGNIQIFNEAAEKMIGGTAGKYIGRSMNTALKKEMWQLLSETLHKGVENSDVEIVLPLKGRPRYVSCSTALVEFPDSGQEGAILVFSDVTRIKQLEQERGQIQRLASLGEIAAGLAHEIKNPLVSIKTFAELLPQKYEHSEFRGRFSRIVTKEVERINQLLGELLNFARNTPIQREKISLPKLVEEVMVLLNPQVTANNIAVRRLIETQKVHVFADKNQIKQALLNICLNGIQAMPNGGVLTVKVQNNSENPSPGRGNGQYEGKISIVVEDTGLGIAREHRDKVFDPFFTTKPEGVGVGLSLSHKIIVDHGGTIHLSSITGKGTAVAITLPLS